jgi:hypothetical protein
VLSVEQFIFCVENVMEEAAASRDQLIIWLLKAIVLYSCRSVYRFNALPRQKICSE